MTHPIPTVRNGTLHEHIEEVPSIDVIEVGSNAWYTWLENHSTFRCDHPSSSFTARKEQRSGGWYWYAYRRHAGRLRTVYVGRTAELSVTRLEEIAADLAGVIGTQGLQMPTRDHVSVPNDSQLSQPGVELIPRNNLPPQLTSFVGREQDAAAVVKLLRHPEVRLLTLTGPAGVGKTRLALAVTMEIREHFADGTCFVPLAPIGDPDLVGSTIAQTLGMSEVGALPIFERIKASLRHKHFLLLLDNFEQVVRAAPQVMDLLMVCPQLKVLVTSRQVLHLQAEHLFPVPPLALPDLDHLPERKELAQYAAVSLFLQRAQALLPGFQLTEANARAIAEICVHLDGLPLAIELAAARVRLLPPQALLARLSQRLAVLMGGAQDVPARQQTLRDTIAWSYDLLTAQEQRLFRCLSVFVGGFTLEEAEAVSKLSNETEPGAVSTMDVVGALLDKSLLLQGKQEGEEPRLTMFETIREYGLKCLRQSGEMELTRRAHANYYLALAEEAEPELSGPQQTVWLERLDLEHGNLRAALGWSLEQDEAGQGPGDSREMALRFGIALRRFWNIRGHLSEGRAFLERALAASEGAEAAMRAKALQAVASLVVYQGDHERGEALCRESLAQSWERGDTAGTAFSLYLLGILAWEKGELSLVRSRMEESLARYKELNDKESIAHILTHLADLASQQGEYARAQALYEESLAINRELGNAREIAGSLGGTAWMLFVSQGDPTTVRALFEESLVLYQELGDKYGMANSLFHLGLVALQQDDVTTARRQAEESVVLSRVGGVPWETAWSLSVLARVEAHRGEHAAARVLYEESLEMVRKIGDKLNIAFILEGMASLLVTQAEPAQAARLWGAAEALRESMGTPIWPVERAAYERSVERVRAQLGEKPFATAWAEGRTMTPEPALASLEPATCSGPSSAPSSPSAIVTPAPKAATSPDGLTTREVEVLRLLAQGLTSAQIAEQLVIGVVTVNFHVRSIYSKLGVSSRSAATRYAIEHRLV
jgi:predicted ATPase/DNA-binding CsgD family transcriptional regulator